MTNLNPVTLEAHYQRYLQVLGVAESPIGVLPNHYVSYSVGRCAVEIQAASRPVWLAMSLHWLLDPPDDEIATVRAALRQQQAVLADIARFLPNWESWVQDEQLWCLCRHNPRGHEKGVSGCEQRHYDDPLCPKCRHAAYLKETGEFIAGGRSVTAYVTQCCGELPVTPAGKEWED